MLHFANKTQLHFDLSPDAVLLTSTGNTKYSTPDDLAARLGELSRLQYLRAALIGKVQLDQSDSVTVSIRLTASGVNLLDKTLEINGDVGTFRFENIDLSSVAGTEQLKVVIDCDSAAGAASGQVFAVLDVEHPIIISA